MTDQYKKALALAGEGDFLELGQSLYGLKKDRPELFRRFLQEAQIGSRKAYHLVAIWEWSRKHRLPRGQLLEAKWTKLRVIRDHMAQADGGTISRDQVKEWVQAAAGGCTVHQLRTIMAGGKTEKARCVLLYFTSTQYQTYEAAILANGGRKRSKGRGLFDQEKAILRLIGNTSRTEQGNPHRGKDKKIVPEVS